MFTNSFLVTYTDPTVAVFEADSNIMPEFSEEIETYFPIDFSGETQEPLDQYIVGHLSDYESDTFAIQMLDSEYNFAQVSIGSGSFVTLDLDLEEA